MTGQRLLEGKTAIVTGGNSGLGLATAQRFAAEGAQVCIFDLETNRADAAMLGVRGDVRDLADLDRLREVVKARFGRVDILFANAGIGETNILGETTEAQFDRMFGINVKGMLFTVQAVLPIVSEGASIILTSSAVNSRGNPDFSIYSATKAAIRSFARCWATDLMDRKIRVNAISPGPIDTAALGAYPGFSAQQTADYKTALAAKIPMRRLGLPDEVAKVACFLASDASSYMTGAELPVDGGRNQI